MRIPNNANIKRSNSQLEVDNLFISIRDISNRLYFEPKKKYYQKLLQRCTNALGTYWHEDLIFPVFYRHFYFDKSSSPQDPFNYNFIYPDLESIREGFIKKERVLIRLISVIDKIIENSNDVSLRSEFNSLEEELSLYLDGIDHFLQHKSIYQIIFSVHELKDKLRTLRNYLRHVIKYFSLRTYRDLRQSFRNIIKFLFKNMDDESDANDVLRFSISTTLFNHSIHYHGKEGNYSKIKCT